MYFIINELLKNKNIYTIKKFEKNQIIFFEGETCENISIILSGTIYMSSYELEKEVKYNFLSKNEMFGNNLIFSKNNTYKASVLTHTKCKILFIDKDNFIQFLKNNEVLQHYLSYLAASRMKFRLEINLLRIASLKDRLLFYIEQNNNCLCYKTISDLSRTLNTSRETLSRMISTLEKEKLLIKKDKKLCKI